MTGVSRSFRRRRGFAHGTFVVLALLAVVALAVAGSFRVLCVTADGHVGIEPAASTCCGTEAPVSGGDEGGGDDDCGGCIDLVVEGDAACDDCGPACDPAADTARGAASGDGWTNARILAHFPPLRREPDVPRGPLTDLRTVVLRC